MGIDDGDGAQAVCGEGKGNVTFHINYENCYKNNFRNNVQQAVKFYLEQGEDFKYGVDDYAGFILYPHALNPFLKIMETMRESKHFIIIPAFDQDSSEREDTNKPAYLIIKLGSEASYIRSFTVNSGIE